MKDSKLWDFELGQVCDVAIGPERRIIQLTVLAGGSKDMLLVFSSANEEAISVPGYWMRRQMVSAELAKAERFAAAHANCDHCGNLHKKINLVGGNCGVCRGSIGRMFQPGTVFSSSTRSMRPPSA